MRVRKKKQGNFFYYNLFQNAFQRYIFFVYMVLCAFIEQGLLKKDIENKYFLRVIKKMTIFFKYI